MPVAGKNDLSMGNRYSTFWIDLGFSRHVLIIPEEKFGLFYLNQ
jgi:hypothetical protein